MKPKILLALLASGLFVICPSNASSSEAIITWTGNAGYRARINMTYDDAFASVGAWGGGPFGGTPTNQGVTQLSLTFFNPSLQPIFSTNDISNSSINYRFLNVSFDTVSRTLLGGFDVGKDSFAEGEPGSSAGQFYLTGVAFPALHDSFLAQQVDSGGQFTVTVVPEPSIWAFGLMAIAAFVASPAVPTRRGRLKT